MVTGEEFARQFNTAAKGVAVIFVAACLLITISIGTNIYLWNKIQNTQEQCTKAEANE